MAQQCMPYSTSVLRDEAAQNAHEMHSEGIMSTVHKSKPEMKQLELGVDLAYI